MGQIGKGDSMAKRVAATVSLDSYHLETAKKITQIKPMFDDAYPVLLQTELEFSSTYVS